MDVMKLLIRQEVRDLWLSLSILTKQKVQIAISTPLCGISKKNERYGDLRFRNFANAEAKDSVPLADFKY